MKYWVFINNSIQGPFTIKEIVDRRYISSDLLVCPVEISAVKPSSWYFARELSEFDPYLSNREVSVAVDNFDIYSILKNSQISEVDDFDSEKMFNEIIEEERENQYINNYRNRIYDLEKNIRDLDLKLNKALEVIKDYEKTLKEKDDIINKLAREIDEIKKARKLETENFKNTLKSYEEKIRNREIEIDNLKKEFDRIKINNEVKLSEKEKSDEQKAYVKSQDELIEEKEVKEIKNIDLDEKKSSDLKNEFSSDKHGLKEFKTESTPTFSVQDRVFENIFKTDLREDTKPDYPKELSGDLRQDEEIVKIEKRENLYSRDESSSQPVTDQKQDVNKTDSEISNNGVFTENSNDNNIVKPKSIFEVKEDVNFSASYETDEKIEEFKINSLSLNRSEPEKSDIKNSELFAVQSLEKSVEDENEKNEVLKKITDSKADDDNRTEILNSIEINIASFQSESAIEKVSPFQIADVNLEKVETKLDIIESQKIEPVPSAVEDKKDEIDLPPLEKEIDNMSAAEDKKLDINSSGVELKVEKNFEEAFEKNEKINDVLEKTPSQDQFSYSVKTKNEEKPAFTVGNISKKENEIRKEIFEKKAEQFKEDTNEYHQDTTLNEKVAEKENTYRPKEGTVVIRERKTSKLVVLISVGMIIFFFGLVYIFRSGENDNITNSQISRNIYKDSDKTQAVSDKVEKKLDEKENTTAEEDASIAKINQNVKTAIDIVKSYNLGDGKGTVERWLSNTVSSGMNGKEEWNATYLSGNIFVVQYRFLRYKAEPLVYLFEVDVEKKDIIRGINNNAINLLSGRKNTPPSTAKLKTSSIQKHIESDDEMF